MGYLRNKNYIEKTAFFGSIWDKVKSGVKTAIEYSPIGLANKAVKAVTGVDTMSAVTNLGSKMVNNAVTGAKAVGSGISGGFSAAWNGITDSNAGMMSRLFSATPIGMMWNGANGMRQSIQNSMGGAGTATNMGSGGAHTNLG